jgi:hypothetical protein
MPRERRKFKYDELEEHTTSWAINRLDELRDMAQETASNNRYIEDEKEFILESIADQMYLLLELIEPLTHDQPNLIAWSQDFVDEYGVFDKNRND